MDHFPVAHNHLVRLGLSAETISNSAVFFSHNKSANSIFCHGLSAKHVPRRVRPQDNNDGAAKIIGGCGSEQVGGKKKFWISVFF